MSFMDLHKDSLKITVEFKFYTVTRCERLTTEFIDPFFVGGDYWNIKLYFIPDWWVIKLIHSDPTKTFKGTWSATLRGFDAINNITLSKNSLDEAIDLSFNYRDLYTTAPCFIVAFEVKIVLFPSTQENLKEAKLGGVLSDLHRNYEDIARTSDIMITAGDTNSENIPVHKAILTLRSPVFKAMFDSNMSECVTNQIQIPDFNITIIRRMVEFMYKDTFTGINGTSYEDFISLLAIANKYQINSLKEASSRYLSKMFTDDNIADMRNKAILYESPTLLNYCLQFIRSNSARLFNNDSFLSKCNTSTL